MSDNSLSNAELTALVYRSLVRDTLLPSDPQVVGLAALSAIHSGGNELPAGFGADVERDAEWLAGRVSVDMTPWPVLAAMATAADKPHTNVAHESAMENVNAVFRGKPRTNPGLGMWQQAGGGLVVARVDDGGSAQACGLREGDLVVAIDGKAPRPSGLHAIALLAMAEGSSAVLQVKRSGKTRVVELVPRAGVVVPMTNRSLPGAIGYVSVPWFANSNDGGLATGDLVRAALTEFVAAGTTGLIIDLRSGTGGSLIAVRSILSALSSAEDVLGTSEPDGEPVLYAREGELLWPDLPIAVLVNEQSTSAAEVLALGLEELSGAALVGAPTSGGLNALQVMDLRDGYKLVLPENVSLGPKSLAPRPGYRLEPTIAVPNPSADDVRVGVDAQLEAARAWVLAAWRGAAR